MMTKTLRASTSTPKFWRNAAFPFIEAREIEDGRNVCYAPHTHETFSVGVVTDGISTYVNGKHSERVGPGFVVVINPGDVHACNPVNDTPWSYRMLYVDASWLAQCQSESDGGGARFQPYVVAATTDASLYRGLNRLYGALVNDQISCLEKDCTALGFFSDMHQRLTLERQRRLASPKLEIVADYIRSHCTDALRTHDLCVVSGLSASHLIRSFTEQYGMTPHAYQMNARVEYCRTQLRHGRAIVDIAADAGFADQAHMQRTFKRFVAATPGQYLAR